MTEPGSRRELDVVVFGATGYVGRLVAQHLSRPDGAASPGLRVGLAGRSPARLAAVRDRLGPDATAWPLIHADADDSASLTALAARTHVVATTVGPYLRYGLGLVGACVESGTHYADLTGEVLFVREAIDRFHERASRAGARIVTSCGFDSIPSDLAVHLLHRAATADGAGDLVDVTLFVTAMRGGISGGTIDSLRAQIDAARGDRRLRRLLADPYALSPARGAEPALDGDRDGFGIGRDRSTGTWTGPFVMADYNTRIVRRSNALLDWAYGRSLRYREVISFGRSPFAPVLAGATAVGLGAFTFGLGFRPTRALLDRLLPAPGEGPSEQTRSSGHFALEVRATTSAGARYVAHVAARGDPGYQATSVMLGESAACLASDGRRLPRRAGLLTPATAMGDLLVERLRANGFRLDVERVAG